MQTSAWDRNTRLFHWGLAVTISFELISGLYVSAPDTRLYFHLHEACGLVAAAVIALHWMWSFANRDLSILFPWNAEGFARARAELVGALWGRLPAQGRRAGLSSLVHGLGLLAATGMALTGVFIFMVIPGGQGASAASTDYAMFTSLALLHKSLSHFVWAYLGGHLAFAIFHQFRGHSVFGAIFIGSTDAKSAE
ncbi:MAG: cytochrome b/b6 domain-containing protein [Gammaproteobacteria bacterium]